jgi:hypothetical protein
VGAVAAAFVAVFIPPFWFSLAIVAIVLAMGKLMSTSFDRVRGLGLWKPRSAKESCLSYGSFDYDHDHCSAFDSDIAMITARRSEASPR